MNWYGWKAVEIFMQKFLPKCGSIALKAILKNEIEIWCNVKNTMIINVIFKLHLFSAMLLYFLLVLNIV